MAKKKQADKLTPKDIAPAAAQWSRSELQEAIAILSGLLEATEVEAEPEQQPEPAQTEGAIALPRGKRGGGYFEVKSINGYGPYKYLRYWSEGKRKSVYVGPAELPA